MKLDIRAAIAHILRSCVFKFNVFDDINLSTPPAADKWDTLFQVRDVNKNPIGSFSAVHRSDGDSGISYGATRNVNGTTVYNWATAQIAADGTRAWLFSDAKPFRDGLGLGSAFRYSNKTVSGYGFSANQSRSGLTITVTSLSGYTPLVYFAYCSSHSAVDVIDAYISGTTLTFWARNRTSDTLTNVNFVFRILYVKTLLFGANVT